MTQPDIDFLATLGLAELLEPLEHILETGRSDWRGLMEILTTRLQLTSETENLSPDDLRRSLNIYDGILLKSVEEKNISSYESAEWMLNLSNALLRRYPPENGVTLIDPNCIISVFLREVPLTLDQATEWAADWRGRDLEIIRKLRQVKKLAMPVTQALHAVSDNEIDERMQPWEKLIQDLP